MHSEIRAILCSLFYVFTVFHLSLKTCQLMRENVVFLDIFDTCDVMYYWSISLLAPEEERQSAPVSRIGSISQITDAAVEVTESIES